MATETSDLEELCRRAIADPQSITRAERNVIRGWPSPDEDDRLCVAMTGRMRAELTAKSIASPDELTYDEAMILHHPRGVNFHAQEGLRTHEEMRRYTHPTPVEVLCDEAQHQLSMAAGEEEKTAVMNAMKRRLAIERAREEVQQWEWQEFEAARRLKKGTPWINGMLKNGLLEDGAQCWGFVIFRTGCYDGEEGQGAWQRFREYFDKAAEANRAPTLAQFCAIFVEDEKLDGAPDEQLRARFRKMRDGDGDGHLPKGIRTNCFLVADRAVIESEAAKLPYIVRYWMDMPPSVYIRPDDPVVYICAVDPDFEVGQREEEGRDEATLDESEAGNEAEPAIVTLPKREAEKKDEMVGFTGEGTVALPRVFDWLHYVCFNAERGTDQTHSTVRTGWHAIYVQTRVPEAWNRNLASNSGGIYYAIVPQAIVL